jgi:hypothetical protein
MIKRPTSPALLNGPPSPAHPTPIGGRGGSASKRAELRKQASSKRVLSKLADSFVQNSEVASDATNRLSTQAQKMMKEGFVVDVSTTGHSLVEAHAPNEHLEFQHALVARTANALPAFEAGVMRQEVRARTLPFELGEDNRRQQRAHVEHARDGMHARNAELADEFDTLRIKALEKEAEVEELATKADEAQQELAGGKIKSQYNHARVAAMSAMQERLDGACEAQDVRGSLSIRRPQCGPLAVCSLLVGPLLTQRYDGSRISPPQDEAATLQYMKERLEDYLRLRRENQRALKAEVERIDRETARLYVSQARVLT